MGNGLLIYMMAIKGMLDKGLRQTGQSAWANSILIVQHLDFNNVLQFKMIALSQLVHFLLASVIGSCFERLKTHFVHANTLLTS